MFELLGILCGFLVVAAIFVCVFVLPVVAFLRTQRIAELTERVAHLERALRELGRAEAGRIAPTAVQPAEAMPEAQVTIEAPVAAPLAEIEPVVPPAVMVGAGVEESDGSRAEGFDLETWIGRQGLGWVAVILLLFATAFFLKYAFDNEWVGEVGRVAIGVVGGVALCFWGLSCHRRDWRLFSQMLSAAGVVLLYLTTFAAFGYYHLVPQHQAALFLVMLIAETAAIALLYEAPAIAMMAVIGGLLTPILLRTDFDQYRNLFIYLSLLNAGVVGLALFRSWRAIGSVALLGTQALFWGWYQANYHPEKLWAAVAFQCTLFALYLLYALLAHVLQPRRADVEDLARLSVAGFLFAVFCFVLLDEDYHIAMGTLAVVVGMIYTALAWYLQARRPDDTRQLVTVLAVALAFVAMAIPLQAQAAWITVGWAVQGLALWWFGLRVRFKPLQGFGAALLALAVGRFLFIDTPESGGRELFVPIFNVYGLPALLLAGCVFGAAAATRRFLPRLEPNYRVVMHLAALAGVGVTWLVVSKETYDYCLAFFATQPLRYDEWARRAAETALSVAWAVYAIVLLTIGFRIQSGALRWSALALFGLTLGKVFLVDMAQLPGFYRVAAFFVLAVMMAAAAWGYQKFQRLQQRSMGGS